MREVSCETTSGNLENFFSALFRSEIVEIGRSTLTSYWRESVSINRLTASLPNVFNTCFSISFLSPSTYNHILIININVELKMMGRRKWGGQTGEEGWRGDEEKNIIMKLRQLVFPLIFLRFILLRIVVIIHTLEDLLCSWSSFIKILY